MPFPRPLCWTIGLSALALASGSLRVAADTLASSSPFLPPTNVAGEGAPTPDTQLELRGIMTAGGATMFSIYDATHHSSTWLKLNESGHDVVVHGYDANRDTVTVEYQGRTLTLPLHSAKVVAAPVTIPQAVPATAATVGAPQPVGGPVVLNPTPADEQRRLEAIAAEVNRRRAMRAQALQNNRLPQNMQVGQPPPVQPPVAVPAR